MDLSDLDVQTATAINGWLPDLLHLTHPRAPDITRDFLGKRRNDNTLAAYLRILRAFLLWVERSEFSSLAALTTSDVSNYVKGLQRQRGSLRNPKPLANRSRAQVVACLRGYFDAMVRGGALPNNPAASVENYRLNVKIGHYKPLQPQDMANLLDSIKAETLSDLQDRAMIALMGFSCARVSAVTKMKLDDVYDDGGKLHVRLSEKRDTRHYVPCHPELETYLRAFPKRASNPAQDCDPNPGRWLFRRWDKKRKVLSGRPLTRLVCYRIVKRRAQPLGLVEATNHTFRATGITTFLDAGGFSDDARRLANHASVNTTKLYDHRKQAVSADDVARINYRRR